MVSDKSLLEWYMKGFNDELDGNSSIKSENKIENHAYTLGAMDAVIGDDMPSWDYQTTAEILLQLKQYDEKMNKVKTYPASCSTCVFVGNSMCQKGLDNHIKFPTTWDLKKTVCSSYQLDVFMIDIKYISIKYPWSSPTHHSLSEKAKIDRRRLWWRNLFTLKKLKS